MNKEFKTRAGQLGTRLLRGKEGVLLPAHSRLQQRDCIGIIGHIYSAQLGLYRDYTGIILCGMGIL